MSLSFHFRFDVAATKRKSGWQVARNKVLLVSRYLCCNRIEAQYVTTGLT